MRREIVWIEDDITIIDPVIVPLEKAGYRIHRLENPDVARDNIELLARVDLILLDLIMPVGEDQYIDVGQGLFPGLELLKEIRLEYKIDTPVVLFTVASGLRHGLKKELQISDITAVRVII